MVFLSTLVILVPGLWVVVGGSMRFPLDHDKRRLKSGGISTLSRRTEHRAGIPPVVDNVCAAESPFKHLCGKLVCVSKIGESNHKVLCFSIQHQSHCGNYFDVQPFRQKRGLFHVKLDELGFDVLFGQDGQVFVKDFTSV